MLAIDIPLLGFAAFSGTGKTTLLKQLIPILKTRGIRVAVIKHAHHSFDVDHPGKDSHTLRMAGAEQVLLASKRRFAWIRELPETQSEPVLSDALEYIDTSHLDLILVEGFKRDDFPKIELHRSVLQKPLLHEDDTNVIAIATDAADKSTFAIPHLDLNDPPAIADFIMEKILQTEVHRANDRNPSCRTAQ